MSEDRHRPSPIVFLLDCYDVGSAGVPLDLRTKDGFAAPYHRGLIDSCLEGIAEYERLAQDLSLVHVPIAVVCTGSVPHLHQPREVSGVLGYAPELNLARWQRSLDLACESLRHGDRLIIVIRHQQGIAETDLQLDDVGIPVSIIDSVQNAVLAAGRQTAVRLTLIRVVIGGAVLPDGTAASSMCTALAPYCLADAFPIAVETYLVPLADVFVAFWELAQRHLNLRSINISGIPMKKSRKQANLGRKFSVAFLYGAGSHHQTELERIQDQNDLAQGLVRLGSSPWLSRRSRNVFWSQAPDGFNLSRVLYSSLHMVTPSNLSSPLTAPLLKAVVAPNGLLFFSEKESDPPNLIMTMHANRLYIQTIASILDYGMADAEPPQPNPDPIQAAAFVEQFDWVSQMMTLRRSVPEGSRCDPYLLHQIGSTLSARQLALSADWTNCRLRTIFASCMRALLKLELSAQEIRDLAVAIEAVRTATMAADPTFLPSSVRLADIVTIYDSMWASMLMAAAVIRHWSSEHRQAADLVDAAAPPSIRIRRPRSSSAKSTLMDAFWLSECHRMSMIADE